MREILTPLLTHTQVLLTGISCLALSLRWAYAGVLLTPHPFKGPLPKHGRFRTWLSWEYAPQSTNIIGPCSNGGMALGSWVILVNWWTQCPYVPIARLDMWHRDTVLYVLIHSKSNHSVITSKHTTHRNILGFYPCLLMVPHTQVVSYNPRE